MNIEIAVAAIAAVATRELHWQAWEAKGYGPATVIGFTADLSRRPETRRVWGPRASFDATHVLRLREERAIRAHAEWAALDFAALIAALDD